MLKGQDILVALLLASNQGRNWTQPEIAERLGISLGEVNNSLKRGQQSGILRRAETKTKRPGKKLVIRLDTQNISEPTRKFVEDAYQKYGAVSGFVPMVGALEELLVYGLKYFFPPVWGQVTRGVPTAHGSPAMAGVIASSEPLPVWEHPNGSVRGLSLKPIHENAPSVSLIDPALYELLALADVFRIGRAREVITARDLLHQRLRDQP